MHADNIAQPTPSRPRRFPYGRPTVVVSLIAILVCAVVFRAFYSSPWRRIGATATVTEVSTGLTLEARVDTGAAVCSIHCEKIVSAVPSTEPNENVNRPIRFLVKNRQGESRWIVARLADFSGIRTAAGTSDRHFVSMRLRCVGVEKSVLVTLNDRREMRYPLLIGRNFLRDDFVVDVTRDVGDRDFD